METLLRHVRQARRRLLWQALLPALCWGWGGGLLAAAVVQAASNLRGWGFWPWLTAAGGLALGSVAAGGWVFLRRPPLLEAAVEIDRRFHLRERVSSALVLDETRRASPVGQALVRDAVRHLRPLALEERFALRATPRMALPLLAGMAALVAAMLVGPWGSPPQAAAAATAEAQNVQRQIEELRRRLAETRRQVAEQGLKEADDVLAKIEKELDDLKQQQRQKPDAREALVKLNDLSRQLQERRAASGGAEQLRQQFKQLGTIRQGPAEEFAKALQRGDFQRAADELENLRRQLQQENLDAAAKQALQEQLEALQEKLAQMAQAQQEQLTRLQQQLADHEAAGGDQAQRDALEEQIADLQQRMNNALLDQLANELGQVASSLKQGDPQQAQQALEGLQGQLSQLQQQLDQMQALDQALDQLGQCKGCLCQGGGGREGQGQRGGGQADKQGAGQGQGAGFGLGHGQGAGERPEEPDQTGTFDTTVSQQDNSAAAVAVGLADGPNAKGRVREAIEAQFRDDAPAKTDPLVNQRLPRSYRDHTREYFESTGGQR